MVCNFLLWLNAVNLVKGYCNYGRNLAAILAHTTERELLDSRASTDGDHQATEPRGKLTSSNCQPDNIVSVSLYKLCFVQDFYIKEAF